MIAAAAQPRLRVPLTPSTQEDPVGDHGDDRGIDVSRNPVHPRRSTSLDLHEERGSGRRSCGRSRCRPSRPTRRSQQLESRRPCCTWMSWSPLKHRGSGASTRGPSSERPAPMSSRQYGRGRAHERRRVLPLGSRIAANVASMSLVCSAISIAGAPRQLRAPCAIWIDDHRVDRHRTPAPADDPTRLRGAAAILGRSSRPPSARRPRTPAPRRFRPWRRAVRSRPVRRRRTRP